jgi:pantoate--beta-alanine ligase
MIIFHEIGAFKRHISLQKQKGCSIGFVPTMGALHQGHLSLIRNCRSAADVTVCSIFINPTQFNDPADFAKYPITTAGDIQLLLKQKTDILFLPAVDEIYPAGVIANRHYDLGHLETILEGAHRPGHFQGVCQVVHRLLDIVEPDKMFLGQKDYQQCMVLKKLVELLNISTKILIGETIRESSGLAMSSRNLRLSVEERQKATAIYTTLLSIKNTISENTITDIQQQATTTLLENGFNKVDYVAIADADTLQLVTADSKPGKCKSLVALIAAFMGEVRLIDNMIVT